MNHISMFLYIIGIKFSIIMYEDRIYRPISYHDTWISIDPIQGCPHNCVYCVLRHGKNTSKKPVEMITVSDCVDRLLKYPLFIFGNLPLAIGNETDMLHSRNITYLINLLNEIEQKKIPNPIVLLTKSQITSETLDKIKRIRNDKLIFFISYSGLGKNFEPGFNENRIRQNFTLIKSYNFPLIHFWRPLISKINTKKYKIRDILAFVSSNADATVFIGLKLHPQLSQIIMKEEIIPIPEKLQKKTGEWLSLKVIQSIYEEARKICPQYPLYRHTSCAISSILGIPNHTATFFRTDICPVSQCNKTQRNICKLASNVPDNDKISSTLKFLGRKISYKFELNSLYFDGTVSQEEFAFMLHNLNYPLKVKNIKMQNLYHGDIYKNQNQN